MKLSRLLHLAIGHSSFDTSVISLNEMTDTQDERREQAMPIRAPRRQPVEALREVGVISFTKSYQRASKLTLSEIKWHSLIILALIGASISHIAGMDQRATPSSTPELAPLRALLNECIGDASIEKAFNETFGRMCEVVIANHDLPASRRWLQSQAIKTEIDSLIKQLTEKVNRQSSQTEITQRHINQLGVLNDYACYFLHIFRTFDCEADQLQRKMALLISLLDDAIATNQMPSYFDTSQHLQSSIERRMMWGCVLL